MKTLVALLLAVSGLLPAVARADDAPPTAAPAKGGLRYTIAVTSFENRSKYAGTFALADTWGALLTEALTRSGHFIVIGESDMRAAATAEQDFANGGRAANGGKGPRTGQMTPAQLLIKGEITHFEDGVKGGSGGLAIHGINLGLTGSTAEINAVVYVVDSTTGQVVASKKVVGEAKSSSLTAGFTNQDWSSNLTGFKNTNVGKAVETAIDEAVEFCAAQLGNLPWSGSVIVVHDRQVYINRGAREGVAAGQVFKVGLAEALRDPGTGELLDTTFNEKARIKVDIVKEKISICSVISGAGVANGMSVSPL
jgi:curli biogenesis system outer membrane secretion channel CsgG